MALPTAASVVSSGLSGYPTVYYDKVALDTLHSNLFMYNACDLRPMPDRSGVAMQIFDYSKMAANTTPATEGTPAASGQTLTQVTGTINLSNYVDFVTISNKVKLTQIDDTVAAGAKLLAYRGALSVDNVISTAADVAANTTTLDRIDVADGSYFSAAIARKAVSQLRSFDVRPQESTGKYFGITHSLTSYDLINDASAGGLLDLQKYSVLAAKNQALVGIEGEFIGNVGGCNFWESNAVPTETNWQSSSHNAYHTYVVGHQAWIASSLGKTELSQKNFSVIVRDFPVGSNSLDLGGLIAAGAVYNFWFGITVAPQHASSDKFRRMRSESSIG